MFLKIDTEIDTVCVSISLNPPLNPFLLAPPNQDTYSYKWIKLILNEDIDTETVSISVSIFNSCL